jgi:subtilisin family serine protease
MGGNNVSEQQRLEEAVDLILSRDDRAAAYPENWRSEGRVQYFYRRNSILVRTRDADQVEASLRSILAGDQEEQEAERYRANRSTVVSGVVKLEWAGNELGTPEVLEQLDGEYGVGTATPVHGLSLCPNSGHPCPATDPAIVPSRTFGPLPPVSDGTCCGTHGWDGDGAVVGIVDGGLIDYAPTTWPWLAGVYGDRDDPLDGSGLIEPYAGHGTFVAGCVRSVAPRAEVYVRRAEEIAGLTYEDEVVRRMSEVIDGGADIIVCEFAGTSRLRLPMLSFSAFYDDCLRHLNVVVVAPAGNDTSRLPMYPAAYSWAVGVGALSANGNQRAYFSNYGGWVDVYAPGTELVNAFAVGDYDTIHDPKERRHFDGIASWSGTSFSTPLVAGMIATRMSATGENAPQATEALLRFARSQAVLGVGPVLFPHQACGGRAHDALAD